MNNISQSHPSVNTTAYYSALDAQLLWLWKEIPQWAITDINLATYVIGIVANTLLLIYFYKSSKYRVPVFTVFTSLALCDWMTCFTCAFIGTSFIPENKLQRGAIAISKLIVYLQTTSYHSSLCHLIFLAGLRYFQLCHPLQAHAKVTFSIVFRCCVSVWLFCALISIPYGIYYTIHNISYNNVIIGIFYFYGNYHLKETMKVVFCEVLPLLIISSLHLLKTFKVSKIPKLTQQERRSRSSRTVTVIITLFVLSVIPSMTHSFYHSLLGYPVLPLHTAFFVYTTIIHYGNSILNPFVYILSSGDIRNNIRQSFCDRRMQT